MRVRQFGGVSPYFLVDDVVRAAEYYRDALGFTCDRFWGDPPVFCMVRRGGAVIMLRQCATPGMARPNRSLHADAWDAYISVRDVNALRAELVERGAKILREPHDAVYQMREMEVEAADGYVLCFGQETGKR